MKARLRTSRTIAVGAPSPGHKGESGHRREERGWQVIDHGEIEVFERSRAAVLAAPDMPVMMTMSAPAGPAEAAPLVFHAASPCPAFQ